MSEQIIKAKKQAAGIILLLVLIAITFFFYLRGYSFHDLRESLKDADFIYLFIGACMMLFFIYCETVNIQMIAKVLGYKISFRRSLEYSSVGFYFNSITPSSSGGEPAQIYYMSKDKIPLTVSSIIIFFIVFVYQAAMLLIGGVLSLLRNTIAIWFVSRLKLLFLFGIIANSSIIFVLSALMFSRKLVPVIISLLIKAASRIPFCKHPEKLKTKLEKSMIIYREKALLLKEHPVLFLKVLFVTIIQMMVLNVIPALVYIGLGNKPEPGCILDLLTSQSLLTIAVSAFPLPGAEGVSQSGFLQVFNYFFDQQSIIPAMLIQRTLSFYIPLLFSFLVYMSMQLRMIGEVNRGVKADGK